MNNEDFRDAAAIAAMQTILRAFYRDETLISGDDTDVDIDVEIAVHAWDSAAALLAERTKRFGPAVPANPAPVFELPEDLDEPVPYRPATNPPPPMSGAEVLDKIHEALPDAFDELTAPLPGDEPPSTAVVSRGWEQDGPDPRGSLDELEPASSGTRETDPAPAPNESGTIVVAPAEQEGGSDVDAAWGAVTDARGPLRQCEEKGCGCKNAS